MKSKLQNILSSAVAASSLAFSALSASADPVSILAYKLGVDSRDGNAINAANGWLNNGGFNEANAAAQLLSNTSLDYKNSLVDTGWAQVLSVQIAMYSQGVKVAEIDFGAGSSKSTFFTAGNVTSTTFTDTLGALFFGIPGDAGNGRNWFIENNYGGCGNDTGHWVIVDQTSTSACNWETSRKTAAGRAFLYSTATTMSNWNDTSGRIGSADVFAVFVTVDQPAVGELPEPATLALVGLGLIGASLSRRRAKQPQ